VGAKKEGLMRRSGAEIGGWSGVVGVVLVAVVTAGCSGVSIDAARQLGLSGGAVAAEAKQAAIASDEEYLRARDAEALFHGLVGLSGSDKKLEEILRLLDSIHLELTKRGIVFERMTRLYEAFGDLAGFDAATATEAALNDLGGAIQDYAQQLNRTPPASKDATAVISKIGGLLASEIQKAKIKEASALIRGQVEAFARLLGDPLVREQMVGFRDLLGTDRKVALLAVWRAGVLDPKPLLDDLGSVGGLVGHKDAAQRIADDARLRNALGAVLDRRLAMRQELLEQGYDASVDALKRLGAEHEKLENEQPIDLARLRTMVGQLRAVVDLLGRSRRGGQ
jgi:hypothetical protein